MSGKNLKLNLEKRIMIIWWYDNVHSNYLNEYCVIKIKMNKNLKL